MGIPLLQRREQTAPLHLPTGHLISMAKSGHQTQPERRGEEEKGGWGDGCTVTEEEEEEGRGKGRRRGEDCIEKERDEWN